MNFVRGRGFGMVPSWISKVLHEKCHGWSVWNGFLLVKIKGKTVHCRCCGGPDGDGHLFWESSFLPLVSIREDPEFHEVNTMDKSQWPWCILWHGCLPSLSGKGSTSPLAVTRRSCQKSVRGLHGSLFCPDPDMLGPSSRF